MNTTTKLKICNWSLLVATAMALISGIQLEILGGSRAGWIWAHIGLCLLFAGLCALHIWLHFKKGNWFARFSKQKSRLTKVLWWVSLLTLITGIIATVRWTVSGVHGPIGAVHGKLGFLMIIAATAHIVRRKKFFFRR